MRAVLLLSALFALVSCASLTEEECRAGDWFRIGLADGTEGRGPDRIEAHRRACADAGVTPDAEAWLKGRERGLRLYCVPQKAYEVGRQGRAIAEGCTPAERARMAPAYEWGRQYWRLELQADDLRGEIRDIDRELAALPPDSPRRGALFARRSLLLSRLGTVELQQRRYASWP
ncbi:MAG: DUF2799 domain-containing protein [Rhodobacteraceae bacterium]|nr:DUF2799 domain-containing protein [Paracoccaceae bacterium]